MFFILALLFAYITYVVSFRESISPAKGSRLVVQSFKWKMYSMSNVVLSGLLLAFNLLGMMALMMTSKRHRDKFHHDEQKRYITKQQWLRWLGLLLLLIGFIFPFLYLILVILSLSGLPA